MPETIALKLPMLVAEQAQKHVTHNEALRALDALVHLSVKDRDLAAPPGSPADGDRYIVAASPTGGWTGHAGDVAVFQDGAWDFHDPREGWRAWVDDENTLLAFDGSAWTNITPTITALQNLTLLGIGATADATNPFSAKLNKALWAAKTAAEGGDGDLRYTMNKETATDVLSLLMQRGFSGRAELGLIGDDNFTLKVSADGSTWVTALVIEPGGKVALGGAFTPTELLQLRIAGGTAVRISAEGEGGVNNQVKRYSANGSQPNFLCYKGRGSLASKAYPNQNDSIGNFGWDIDDGTTDVGIGSMALVVTAATPSNTARDARWVLSVGTGSSNTEIVRAEHATGLSMFGANPVIDQNRHFRLRSYTVATLPSASPAAQLIYVSDGTSNKRLAVSDGTNWRFPDGNVVS